MMKRKCFAGSRMDRLRQTPGDKFRNRNRRGASRRQRGQVQRLANMAGRVAASVFMLMQKRAAGGKVEQRDSGQQGQRAACVKFGEDTVHESLSTSRVHYLVPA